MENLGEQIYKYRTARGLSQLELAEALDVSRQSISKWETNVAVPELAKLVKMADLFGVTLDELILDKKAEMPAEEEILVRETVHETVAEIKREERKPSVAKTVFGVIFLVVGILFAGYCLLFGAWLTALAFLTPCVLSAVFCLRQFRFAALWCLHTWFVFISLYLLDATGISWSDIYTSGSILRGPGANPWHVVTAWVLFIVQIVLVTLTVYAYRKDEFHFSSTKRFVFAIATFGSRVVVGWVTFIVQNVAYAICGGVDGFYEFYVYYASRAFRMFWEWLFLVFDFAEIALFTVFLVPTFYYAIDLIKERRALPREKQ